MNNSRTLQRTRQQRLTDMTNPPPPQEKKPANALWIAYVFFNLIALLMDIAAMLTVRAFTNWLYGVLVFMAGFLPLLMHEQLFTRPYASTKQKIISIVGIVTSVGFILTVGILGGIVNVLDFNTSIITELAIIVMLVVVAVFHGILAGVYFFIDTGIRRQQVRAQKLAYYETLRQSLVDTKQVLGVAGEVLDMEDEITQGAAGGDSTIVDRLWSEFTGRNVFTSKEEQEQAPAANRFRQAE